MGSGLIKGIAVTPANITDQEGFKHICPDSGMVFADKQYCCKKAQDIMKANNCHSGSILKNNMLKKNKDKDRWLSSMRASYEGVFSKLKKRAIYRGLAKVQLQVFLEANSIQCEAFACFECSAAFYCGGVIAPRWIIMPIPNKNS